MADSADSHVFPAPFVVSPIASHPHTHTLILLHGRGDSGPSFGSSIYIAETSSGFSLPALYPGLKFVFPTTATRYSDAFRRTMTEWFNTASLTFPEEQGHMQTEGLREAVKHIQGLVADEIRNGIPEERIILGGISQGCATALHVLLSHRKRLGGFVGMSGWLPFASNIREICELKSGAGLRVKNDGSIAREGDSESEIESEEDAPTVVVRDPSPHELSRLTEALAFVRRNLSLPPGLSEEPLDVLRTPVFLGHGDADHTVDYKLGRNIYTTLSEGLGMDVTWKRYRGFGHWYKQPDEIDDIVDFWGEKCGLVPS